MSYDEKCLELATHFMHPDMGDKRAKELAQRIQDFIEDELEAIEREARFGDDPRETP